MQRSRQRTERSEDRQPASGRPAARRETSGGGAVPPPLTADALCAAQRGAGNAATAGMIARRAAPTAVSEQPDTGVHEVLRSVGKPLAAPVRRDMEARFGTDFSDVRLHTGATAARSARAIGARAYTSGSHVVIGDGGGDQHILAHELTHVVQQRQGPVSGTDHGDGLRVSDPSDRFEREAEANAHKVMSAPAPDVQRTPESVGRDVTGEGDTVQRASATVLENATVASYKPGKESTPPLPTLHDLPIQVRALAHDRAAFLSHQDYENISAQGQTPGTSAAGTYMQGMSRSTFPKNRRDKLIQSYVDAGWVTKTGTGKSATYTLDDVPAPASDSDLDSGSESDDVMSIDSRQSSPGQPFGTIRFDSQSSDSDSDYEDRMSISSD